MTLNISRFVAGLRGAQAKAKSSAMAIQGAFSGVAGLFGIGAGGAVLSTGGLALGVKNASAAMSEMYEMSKRSGTGWQDFQKMAQYFKEAGVSSNDFGNMLVRLERKVAEARGGNEGLQEALGTLGIRMEELDNLAPDEMMLRFADAMKEAGNSSEAFAALFKLLEDDGKKVRDSLAKGSKEIKAQMEEIAALSEAEVLRIKEAEAVFSRIKQKAIVKGAEVGSATATLWQQSAGLRGALGTNQAEFEAKKFLDAAFGGGAATSKQREHMASLQAQVTKNRKAYAADVEANPLGSITQKQIAKDISIGVQELKMIREGSIQGAVADPVFETH